MAASLVGGTAYKEIRTQLYLCHHNNFQLTLLSGPLNLRFVYPVKGFIRDPTTKAP